MNATEITEMGPVDYVLIEWSGGAEPDGSALPHLIAAVEAGVVRILDFAFITKDADGNASALDASDLATLPGLGELAGAASGLVGSEDIDEAAQALDANSSAALLVYENTWAAPFATALRENGAQLVAGGRIPVQALIAALDALENEANNDQEGSS